MTRQHAPPGGNRSCFTGTHPHHATGPVPGAGPARTPDHTVHRARPPSAMAGSPGSSNGQPTRGRTAATRYRPPGPGSTTAATASRRQERRRRTPGPRSSDGGGRTRRRRVPGGQPDHPRSGAARRPQRTAARGGRTGSTTGQGPAERRGPGGPGRARRCCRCRNTPPSGRSPAPGTIAGRPGPGGGTGAAARPPHGRRSAGRCGSVRRQSGTGSWNPRRRAAPGRHRSRRARASRPPRSAPCRCRALTAYVEQLGVYGQQAGRTGLTVVR